MDREEFENSSIEEYLEEEPENRADFEDLAGFYYDIEVEEEYGSISFIAGPCIGHGETTSDAFTCYAYLEQFLNEDTLAPFIQKKYSDVKSVWIGASENHHTINDIIPGKYGELEAKLIEILEAAGFERNSELGDDMRAE